MNLLFIGQTARGQTSGMRARALERLGLSVGTVDSSGLWQNVSRLQRVREQHLSSGANIGRFNETVRHAIRSTAPRILWMEKQEYIEPETIYEAQQRGVFVVHYNPDPYFSLEWKRTKSADACLRMIDLAIVTKRYEISAYETHGVKEILYSPLGFDPVVHAPSRPVPSRHTDMVFVGGWEPRRERLIAAASKISSSIHIWGYGWRLAQRNRVNPLRAMRLGRLTPGRFVYWGAPRPQIAPFVQHGEPPHGEIYAEDYANAVSSAAVSLGFLRELCPDQHTTRTFELPAMGGFLLADRTDEHLEFFDEGKEAEFFGDDNEFLDKVSFYLRHDSARERVARAGRERCLRSGYSYDDRLRKVLDYLHPSIIAGARRAEKATTVVPASHV